MQSLHIGDRIGQGGMADVFLALQHGMGGGRLVVVKRIAAWARADEDYVQCFLREARVATTVNHPNIVTTLDVGEDEEGFYLVMEYLSGETLSFVLRTMRKTSTLVPVALACRIVASVASALDFIHQIALPDGTQLRVVHRDVNPANVMLCYNGQVKLLDFGVAKLLHEEGTRLGMVKGKPSYMAPEQVAGKALDERTDIFQLGIMLWEILAGQRLYSTTPDEAIVQAQHAKIQPPSELREGIPPELDELVMWMLASDMDDRCPSARMVLEGLQSLSPDLFGTMSGRSLQAFMGTTFPDRREHRRALERRTLAMSSDLDEASARSLTTYSGRTAPSDISRSLARPPAVPPQRLAGPSLRLTLAVLAGFVISGFVVIVGGVALLTSLTAKSPVDTVGLETISPQQPAAVGDAAGLLPVEPDAAEPDTVEEDAVEEDASEDEAGGGAAPEPEPVFAEDPPPAVVSTAAPTRPTAPARSEEAGGVSAPEAPVAVVPEPVKAPEPEPTGPTATQDEEPPMQHLTDNKDPWAGRK